MKDLKTMTVEEFAMLDEVYGDEAFGEHKLIYDDGNIFAQVIVPDEVNAAVLEEGGNVWESKTLMPYFEELRQTAISAK